MRRLGLLDGIAAWGLVLLGCVHNLVAAPKIYPQINERMFWFVGTGLALWYAGALNLARRSTPTSRTTTVASVLANLSLFGFVLAFGLFTGAIRRPEGMVLVALVATATLVSAITGGPLLVSLFKPHAAHPLPR